MGWLILYLVLLPLAPWLHSHGTSSLRVAATVALGWTWPWLLPLWLGLFLTTNILFPTKEML